MAAVHSANDGGKRSSLSSHQEKTSHGRGGAGNIGISSADLDLVLLETPSLKGEVYTTGRGGTGNMACNDDPAAARRAQDVIGLPRRESTSNTHVGRGGAANVFKPSAEEIEKAKEEKAKWETAVGDGDSVKSGEEQHPKGFADTGKDWLLRHAGVHGTIRRKTVTADDNSSTTLTEDQKKSRGLADKGKDWIYGAVSGVVSNVQGRRK